MVIRITSVVLSVAGVLTLISGLLFWTGAALNLVSMHMLLGFLSVAALWIVGIGGLFQGGSWITAAGTSSSARSRSAGPLPSDLMLGPLHWSFRSFTLSSASSPSV
jgi:hypothetical protein